MLPEIILRKLANFKNDHVLLSNKREHQRDQKIELIRMRKYLRKKVFKVYGLMCHESSFKQRVSHRILISPSL